MSDILLDRIRAHRSAPDVYDPPTFEEMADRILKLEKAAKKHQKRAEVLEELVMDVVADCREGLKGYEIEARVAKVMRRLEEDE
jgi:hypothetical protein